MKNLVLLFVLVMLSFNSQSQCSEPKNTPWVLKDGISDISSDQGFVVIVRTPELFYDKGKTSFRKVEKIKESFYYKWQKIQGLIRIFIF